MVPDYGIGAPVSSADVQRLMDAFSIRVFNVRQDVAAYILPPDSSGRFGLRLRDDLVGKARLFWMLHDLDHVIHGEADEKQWIDYDDPYPAFERRADKLAATGVLHERDRQQDAEWVELVIDRELHIDVPSWKYRKPEIAKAVAK